MKFSGKDGNGPMDKWLNFDGDPDQESGHGSGSGSVSRQWYDVPWRRYALSQCFYCSLLWIFRICRTSSCTIKFTTNLQQINNKSKVYNKFTTNQTRSTETVHTSAKARTGTDPDL